jgi:hypothetical protein
MRPKIVILTLVAAFVVLGVVALLKGMAGKNAGGQGDQPPAVQAAAEPPVAGTNGQSIPAAGANAAVTVSPEMRAAFIAKEVEQISELQSQADGSNNLMIIAAILDKFSQPEAEVRQAALDALRALNDTNAVPGLEKAAENLKDPREKVAVLDTIDYLKMPSVTDGVPPDMATNYSTHVDRPPSTNFQFNPAFLKGNKNIRMRNNSQQAPPANAPANAPAEAPAQQPQ